jgi:hypothetical protein
MRATEYFVKQLSSGKTVTVSKPSEVPPFTGEVGKGYMFEITARSVFGSSYAVTEVCNIPPPTATN